MDTLTIPLNLSNQISCLKPKNTELKFHSVAYHRLLKHLMKDSILKKFPRGWGRLGV